MNEFEFVPFIDVSDKRFTFVLEAWKKTIDVQQHFNDLELRIRNYAVTVLVAMLGAVALALKESLAMQLYGFRASLAEPLVIAALLGWLAFYFMDRWWYHRLLYGSVMHAQTIESRYGNFAPELSLTKAIGAASPVRIFGWKIRSPRKIDLFYGAIAALLLITLFSLHRASSFLTTVQPATTQQNSKVPSPSQNLGNVPVHQAIPPPPQKSVPLNNPAQPARP